MSCFGSIPKVDLQVRTNSRLILSVESLVHILVHQRCFPNPNVSA